MSICAKPPEPAVPADDTAYMRPLPLGMWPLNSEDGRQHFKESLLEGTMEGYFRLAQQFHTQADPAYCGLGSLVCALNALQIDPNRTWKGPWRWFSEDLLDCCKSLEDIRQSGLTLDETACLARCSSAAVTIHRPSADDIGLFRQHIHTAAVSDNGPVLVSNYSRRAVGQTGGGHFSPIAGYHAKADRALVLDTARFKYPAHWISIPLLFNAMLEQDPDTQLSRGWLLLGHC